MLDVILAPDVYVNASVALGSSPDRVVQRVLGRHKGESKTTRWILDRVKAMLEALPTFKKEAIEAQIELIRGLVQVVDDLEGHEPADWKTALVAAAKTAGVSRVLTDHPDLLGQGTVDGVEFLSTDTWLVELSIPPPVPPAKAKTKSKFRKDS
ncbi:MAG: hypothetical protein JXA30_05760 [Deltaproteobacteria bacterium]|nr:hypothetical protein [Deltaproteobacteria bacterium]